MSTLMRCARPGLLAAFLLGLPLAAAARAEEPARPAAEGEADKDKAAREAALRLKVMDAARRMFFRVVITPKWDEDSALESLIRGDARGRGFWGYGGRAASARLDNLMETHLARRTIVVPAVLLDKGLVALDDDGTGWEWKLIGRIEAVDAAGKRWPAKVARLFTKASAFAFVLEGENLPEAPAWREGFKLSAAERVISASLVADGVDPDKWYVSSAGALLPFDSGPAAAERLTYAGRSRADWAVGLANAGVIFDAEARPVGVTLQGTKLDNEDLAAWQPKAMLGAGSVAWSEVEKAQAKASAEALRVSYKVRFEFRVEKDEEEESGGAGRYRPSSMYRGEGGSQDAEIFGVAVDPGRIFIPQTLDIENLRMLDKVSVKVGEEWKPAAFVGSFREVAGMLVEVSGVKLAEPPGLFETKGVGPMKPFIYCQAEELLGKVRADARTVRFLSMHRTYADRLRPEAHFVPQGALLFDLEGRLAGIAVRERPVPTLLKMAARGMYGDSSMGEMNLPGFGELKAMLADTKQSCDPAWRPMTRQESRRLCWLGVEFEPISEELAERLGCAEETRGGNVGLIVSTVYPESPAAKLGIKPQDILLRLKVEGLGDPLPLVARYAAVADGWGRSPMGRMGGAGRTWKSRGNFLTRLLTEAGPGRKAEITYLVAGGKKELKSGAFELAWAPEDYDSAEKYKDEKLGMAVKPITYEVREALGLKADDPGVVISWIEQGSSAQVARLAPYMLIVAVEGKPVRSAAEFKKAVEEVRAQKKDSVKMQVTAMGKSRFADLKLGD